MGGSCACLSRRSKFALPSSSSSPLDDCAVVDETLERVRSKFAIPASSPPGDDYPLVVETLESEIMIEPIEERIERSKSHWSDLLEFELDVDEVVEESNVEIFRVLQSHPKWGGFFMTFGEDGWGELVVGGKLAEGGQGELYDVEVHWSDVELQEFDLLIGRKFVLKVFKKGTSLRQLQTLWPQGLLQDYVTLLQLEGEGFPRTRSKCDVYGGVLLEDGRFAFLMVKEDEDLRREIDHRMLTTKKNCCPFSMEDAEGAMYAVALGVEELHNIGIVHRDLKASNVLRSRKNGGFQSFVADYECSIGVVGTGFFRAPEILQACKDRTVHKRPELFTKEADAYSYGMLCYEILTGKLPFESFELDDIGRVLAGERPRLPNYVHGWVKKLLIRCWQPNPIDRPSFRQILDSILANSNKCRRMFASNLEVRRKGKRALELEQYKGERINLEMIELY